MSDQMTTADVLNRAADLIEERGWVQGAEGWPGMGDGGLCLEGGIMAAQGQACLSRLAGFQTCPAARAVQEYTGWQASLWLWNDYTFRTQEQVIATLRAAALMVAARESQPELVTV